MNNEQFIIVKNNKWFDPEGLNIQEPGEKGFIGTYEECLAELEHLQEKIEIEKAESIADGYCRVTLNGNTLEVYYPHAISKDVYTIKPLDEKNFSIDGFKVGDKIRYVGHFGSFNNLEGRVEALFVPNKIRVKVYKPEPRLISGFESAVFDCTPKDLVKIEENKIESLQEDASNKRVSGGVYSVKNNKWVQEPVQQEIPELNKNEFEKTFSEWEDKYFNAQESENIDTIDSFIDELYAFRQEGLNGGGEFSISNLVFKELRNLGYLDQLKELKTELTQKELSLESMNEQLDVTKYNTRDILRSLKRHIKKNGTYSINDNDELIKEELNTGYQVSFFRPEIGDEDIKRISIIMKERFGEPYLGMYGDPEISFNIKDEDVACDIAKIFNQYSIWDNSLKDEIVINKDADKSKVDYDEAYNKLVNYEVKSKEKDM